MNIHNNARLTFRGRELLVKRIVELPRWMHYYNWHRQHAEIDYQCPINTLGINMNNLLA